MIPMPTRPYRHGIALFLSEDCSWRAFSSIFTISLRMVLTSRTISRTGRPHVRRTARLVPRVRTNVNMILCHPSKMSLDAERTRLKSRFPALLFRRCGWPKTRRRFTSGRYTLTVPERRRDRFRRST